MMSDLEKKNSKLIFFICRFLLVRWFLDEYYKHDKHDPWMLRNEFNAQLEEGKIPDFKGSLCFEYEMLRATSREEAYYLAKNRLYDMFGTYSDSDNYITEYGVGISDIYFLPSCRRKSIINFLQCKDDGESDSGFLLYGTDDFPQDLSRENIFNLIRKNEEMTMYKQQYS